MPRDAAEWTFSLVDLAGFTALTETHGDHHAADLAVAFTDLARVQLGPEDLLVKSIGDAVLLASPAPEAALVLVRGILAACYAQDSYPVARVGIHHGPAVRRGDDFFGTSVNLAARVAAEAAGGQVLATEQVAEAASGLGVAALPLGARALKNLSEATELWDLHLHPAPPERSVDPVCRMLVEHASAAGRLTHDGRTYWFCTLSCAGAFAAVPDRYL